jgi:maltooligosyltrehalose trehalohydrolase
MVTAALLLLAPQTPLLFMGQEWDEANPFLFFTNFGDPALQAAVTQGRRNEFKDFDFGDVPDPQSPATFERSRLNWDRSPNKNVMPAWYSSLLALRRQYVAHGPRTCKATLKDGILQMEMPANEPGLLVMARIQGTTPLPEPGPAWTRVLAIERDGVGVAVYVFRT